MASNSTIYSILVISDYRAVASSRPEAEIFVRLALNGHKVHIISHPDATFYNDRFKSAGIEVFEHPPEHKISRSYIRYLHSLVTQYQYDFVHAFNSKGLTNAVWALRGTTSRLIAYRGYAGQTHWYDPMMYLKYFHPRVDHIICVSADIARILSRNMAGGIKKLSTIPKGHDPVWYNGIIPADRTALGFKREDILVCFLANVRPFKGLTYLLQATHFLEPTLPIQFILIGKGYEAPEIRKEIEDSPFKDRIHTLGFRNDAQSIVAASDCLVQVSTHGEGLSKSVVEAMFLGIAPIISAIPGNEGLVVDGHSGWIVPVKNPEAIARALTDMAIHPEQRQLKGSHAREHMHQHFHIDETVRKYETLYAKLKN